MKRASSPTQTDLRSALECIHGMLEHATAYRLCVSMLASALRHETRNVLHFEANGVRFADQLHRLLEAGGSVRIYLWDDFHKGLIAKNILDLLTKYGTRSATPKAKQIAIRASGTSDMSQAVPHFLIVHPYDRTKQDPELWQLRVEPPPAAKVVTSESRLDSEHVRGLFVEGLIAAEVAPMYLTFIDRLYAGPNDAKPVRITMAQLRRQLVSSRVL
jgi:hypothetical protein